MAKALRLTEEQFAAFVKRGKRAQAAVNKIAKAAPPQQPPRQSKIEQRFEHQLMFGDFPPHVRNYHFISGRDFELDFAWPLRKIGVSIEGMAHRVKRRFKDDIEKHALGLLAGWRILRVGGHQIRHEIAVKWLKQLMEGLDG